MRVLLLAFVLVLAGCAGMFSEAKTPDRSAANALARAGKAAADGLSVACTAAGVAAPDDAAVAVVEARCHEVWRLYDRLRADLALLDSALEAAEAAKEDPNVINIAEAYARALASERAFVEAAADLARELQS